jgi:hypothetical protein
MTKIFDLAFTDVGKFNAADLDTVRKATTTLRVPCDRPAAEIAAAIRKDNPKVVMLLDNDNRICGVVEPGYVQKSLSLYRQQAPDSFADALMKLAQAQLQFPANAPTRERPILFWCDKGQHFSSEPQCPFHP